MNYPQQPPGGDPNQPGGFPPPQQQPPFGQQPAVGQQGGFQQQNTPGIAIGGLVAGILGLFCTLLGPVAVALGLNARKTIDGNPAQYSGRGLAVAAIVLGIIDTVLLVLGIILVVAGVIET